jgi:hypothetical protein
MSKVVVFLAGHGLISNKLFVKDEDEFLGEFSLIFPAQPRGQLCFVAHNFILQSLLRTSDIAAEIGKLKSFHGVSTFPEVGIKEALDGELTVNPASREDRLKIQKLLEHTKDVEQIHSLSSKFSEVFRAPDLAELNAKAGIELRVPHFFPASFSKTKDAVEEIAKSCILPEHALGSWEHSMQGWQRKMPYSPQEGYQDFELTMSKQAEGKHATILRLYIDETKVLAALQGYTDQSPDAVAPHQLKITEGVIYVVVSGSGHFLGFVKLLTRVKTFLELLLLPYFRRNKGVMLHHPID